MKKIWIIGLALATGLVAKGKDPVASHNDAGVGTPQEMRIAKDVRHELLMLPWFGVFDDLAFKINGSEVTLVGSVLRPALKSDAEHSVKRVEGVSNVISEIEVLPLSMNDDRIRMATYRAIFSDSALGTRYGFRAVPAIHIIVKNGNVRLEGVVLNDMDKTIAGMRANGVSGVFAVENALRLEEREASQK